MAEACALCPDGDTEGPWLCCSQTLVGESHHRGCRQSPLRAAVGLIPTWIFELRQSRQSLRGVSLVFKLFSLSQVLWVGPLDGLRQRGMCWCCLLNPASSSCPGPCMTQCPARWRMTGLPPFSSMCRDGPLQAVGEEKIRSIQVRSRSDQLSKFSQSRQKEGRTARNQEKGRRLQV